MTGKIKIAAAAVFSAVLGLAASASHAGTTSVVPVVSGTVYDGWEIIVPGGGTVNLLQDVQSNGSLVLEKFANFSNTSSITIDFVQVGAASSTITIQNENIMNSTGQTWSGFQDSLVSLPGSATFSSAFVPPTGPGYNYTGISTTPTTVTYSGSQAAGSVSIWGSEGSSAGGLLVIDTPTTIGEGAFIVFKETPLTVPVPAAAWSGLTGLMGLGLLASGKKLKKILA